MYRLIPLWVLYFCLLVWGIFTVFFGWAVLSVSDGTDRSGILGKAVIEIALFPNTVNKVLKEIVSYSSGNYKDKGIRVINGIRRGEDMQKLFIVPIKHDGHLAGFGQADRTDLSVADLLTPRQFGYWKKIPDKYRFEVLVGEKVVPRSTLSRIQKTAEEAGFLIEEDGEWRKVA